MDEAGIQWLVWKKTLDGGKSGYHPCYSPYPKPATTEAPPAQMFPCVDAEPQSPRNVNASFVGLEPPRVKPVGCWMKQEPFFNVNSGGSLHIAVLNFHTCAIMIAPALQFGAVRHCRRVPQLDPCEHALSLGCRTWSFDGGEYSLTADEALPDPSAIIPNDIRTGFFCAPVDEHPESGNLDPYTFKWCQDVKKGYTYESHWVFSTAGPKNGVLSGGLGGVFA